MLQSFLYCRALSCKNSIATVTGAASTAVSTCMVKTAGSWMSCCCLDCLLLLQWELEVGRDTMLSAFVSFDAASAFCRTTDEHLDHASALSHSILSTSSLRVIVRRWPVWSGHLLVQTGTCFLAENLPFVVAGVVPKLTLWPVCLLNQL